MTSPIDPAQPGPPRPDEPSGPDFVKRRRAVHGIVAVGVLGLLVAIVSGCGSDPGGGATASSPAEAPAVPAADLELPASSSIADAQRIAERLGTRYAVCYATHFNSLRPCGEEQALGLPAGTIDVRAAGNPPVGTTRSRGRIIVASGKKWGFPTGGFIGIYDRTGFLWGYLVTDEGEIHPACQDLPGSSCSKRSEAPEGERFLNDRAAIERIVAASKKG